MGTFQPLASITSITTSCIFFFLTELAIYSSGNSLQRKLFHSALFVLDDSFENFKLAFWEMPFSPLIFHYFRLTLREYNILPLVLLS